MPLGTGRTTIRRHQAIVLRCLNRRDGAQQGATPTVRKHGPDYFWLQHPGRS